MLILLDLDESLADALVDWIDDDIEVRFPDGAEDETYLLLATPYRTANRPLADISELRLVSGYEPEVIETLRPFVVALPEATPINVNTAGAEVLSSVAPGMDLSDGEGLVQARGEEGFKDVDSFLKEDELRDLKPVVSLLSVQSHWFLMVSEANIGAGRVRLASLIQRTPDTTRVVRRQRDFEESVTTPTEEQDE